MLGGIRGEVRFKESLSFHTSLRIGGPADFFIVPLDVEDVRRAVAFAEQEGLPVLVLGAGTNFLVKDRGVRGVVVRLGGCLERVEFRGEEVVAGGAVRLWPLIRAAAARSLGGLEGMVGIPASLGGAIATGAGTEHGTIFDVVSVAYVLHPDGTVGEVKFRPHSVADHNVQMPAEAIVLGARLALQRRPLRQIQRDLKHRVKARKAATPLALASAGYVWEDPPGLSASSLIRQAGLARKRFGAVEISGKDPSFLINRGEATAAGMLEVMGLIRVRVQERLGVTLNPRIRIIGEQ